jgi:hypothetical protein
MRHTIMAAGAVALLMACSAEQRETIDSATGSIDSTVRGALSVISIDMGRSAGTDKKITQETDTFSASDTIYASVNTSGTVPDGAIMGRWTFPDGSNIEQQAEPVTSDTDADLLFFLTKPEGLPTGKYTFRVIVNGREVRSEDVTVR